MATLIASLSGCIDDYNITEDFGCTIVKAKKKYQDRYRDVGKRLLVVEKQQAEQRAE